MFKSISALMMVWLLAVTALADFEISDSINDVYYRGAHELVGSTTMRLQGNDLGGISPEQPGYIRVAFDHQAVLADTRVDLASADGAVNQPIYLAVYTNSQNPNITVAAPADTVAIVRWVAGENAFWIRVNHPSDQWLMEGETTRAPDDVDTASFTYGISARVSATTMLGRGDSQRNLPFNTRQAETPIDGSP